MTSEVEAMIARVRSGQFTQYAVGGLVRDLADALKAVEDELAPAKAIIARVKEEKVEVLPGPGK